MQKHVNLVDLVKSFPTNIFLQNSASIQTRTSPMKFAHFSWKSGNGSIPNLSTKASAKAMKPCRFEPGSAKPPKEAEVKEAPAAEEAPAKKRLG